MKDIILLIKQRKDFYLPALVLTLLLTIVGAFYNLSVISIDMAVVLNTDITTEVQMETVLAKNTLMFQTGLASDGLMNGFMNNYTYMGYTGINIIILIVVILSCVNINDGKTKEFLETLPVKKVALELYNYVALMGILLINIVTAAVIHLVHFHHYNSKLADLSERFPEILGAVVPKNLVLMRDGALLYQFGMMTLFLLVMTSFWLVLGTLFKKSWVGLVIGFWSWHSMSNFLYDVRVRWSWMTSKDTWDVIPDRFRRIVAVFDPRLFFSRFEWIEGKYTNAFTPFVVTTLVIMLLVMIAVLIVHGYCRELSKGKLFYVNRLNIILLVVGGFYLFVATSAWWGYTPGSLMIATVVTVVAEIIAITLLYYKKPKTGKLAVKERHKVFNPLLAQRLCSYSIAAGVIALIPLLIDWDWNMYSLYLWVDDSMTFFSEKPFYLTYFALEYRYQFAMIIPAGFCLFKLIQFAMTGAKVRREFCETLPMSRVRIFCTKLLMDMCVIIVPLMIFTAVSVGHFVTIRNKMLWTYSEVTMYDMVGEQFVVAFVVLCVAVFFTGVMYLIDAVTISGGMKIAFCGIAALFGGTVSVMILETDSIWAGFVAVIWGGPTVFAAIVYLAIGIGLLIMAGVLYVKRDAAKEIFYYKPVKYVFAAMLSIDYLIYVFLSAHSEQKFYMYFLAAIGTVLIYFLAIHYCTPGRVSELRQRFAGKKTVEKK